MDEVPVHSCDGETDRNARFRGLCHNLGNGLITLRDAPAIGRRQPVEGSNELGKVSLPDIPDIINAGHLVKQLRNDPQLCQRFGVGSSCAGMGGTQSANSIADA